MGEENINPNHLKQIEALFFSNFWGWYSLGAFIFQMRQVWKISGFHQTLDIETGLDVLKMIQKNWQVVFPASSIVFFGYLNRKKVGVSRLKTTSPEKSSKDCFKNQPFYIFFLINEFPISRCVIFPSPKRDCHRHLDVSKPWFQEGIGLCVWRAIVLEHRWAMKKGSLLV